MIYIHTHPHRCQSSRARTSQSRSQSRSASLCQGRVALRWLKEIEQFEIGAERVAPIGYHYLYEVPGESFQQFIFMFIRCRESRASLCQRRAADRCQCRSQPRFCFEIFLFFYFHEGGEASLLRGWFSQVWRWLRWLPWLRNRVRLFVLSLKDLNKDYKQSSSIMLALKSSVKLPYPKAPSTLQMKIGRHFTIYLNHCTQNL